MLPVRCLTCGKCISAILGAFKRLAPERGVGGALDELGVKRFCCRTHFITYREQESETAPLEGELVPGIASISRRCPTRRLVVAR
jgi:DNA-directed RNA polymerase subunit N